MQIKREILLNKLDLLAPGLSSTETVEQSSCIVFRDGLAMTYNEEVACRIKVPLDTTGAVSALPLLNLLRKLPDDDLEVEVRGSELRVQGKRRWAGIYMQAEISLPIDSVEQPGAWKPLDEEFSRAIGLVEPCGSRDESIFSLTCVHLTPKWVEACDNLQLTRYRLATGLEGKALVKRSSIRQIVALGMGKISETDNWIHFKNSDGLIMSCRRYVENYPAMKDFLAVEGTPTKLPKGLAEAVERAKDFSAENSEVDYVLLKLEGDRLTVRGEGPSGWFEETKKLNDYMGPAMSFTISPSILAEIVRNKMSDKCVVSPNRLKVDGGKWTYVTCLGQPAKTS